MPGLWVQSAIMSCHPGVIDVDNGCKPTRPAQPSIAAGLGPSESPCLSWICKPQARKSCEFGERPNRREAQGTRVSGQAFGTPFFWLLFFGGAKKSSSPERGETRS